MADVSSARAGVVLVAHSVESSVVDVGVAYVLYPLCSSSPT